MLLWDVSWFCAPACWGGARPSLPECRWRRREWADFCAGTCWRRTPECPGWKPGRAPARCRPPPPEWQRHWSRDGGGMSTHCGAPNVLWNYPTALWLPASGLLHTLVAVQNTFEQLGHEWLQVGIRRLADHPVSVAAQRPAGDGAHQGLLIGQALDEVGDELRKVRDHALHAAWVQSEKQWSCLLFQHTRLSSYSLLLTFSYSSQHEDSRFLHYPLGMEEQLFE